MPASYWRSALLLACQEDVVGTYKAPSITDVILIGKDVKWKNDVPRVVRDVLRGYIGGPETLPGDGPATVQFKVELCGSGAAATAVPWDLLIRLAGFAATLTPTIKWDYTPISNGLISGSFAFHFGGNRRRMRCACVTQIDFDLTVGKIPTATITVMGIEYGTMESVAPPTGDFTAWDAVEPLVITDANSADIKFGSTYSPATGAFANGTAYPSDGLRLSVKNQANFRARLGGNSVPITGRDITGNIKLDLTADQRVEFDARYKGSGTTAMSFAIGNAAGKKLGIWMPRTEVFGADQENDDDLIVDTYDVRARHTGAGNNAIRLITM